MNIRRLTMTRRTSRLLLSGLMGVLIVVSVIRTRAQDVVTVAAPIIAIPSATVLRLARVELNTLLGTVQVSVYPWVGGAFVTTGPPVNVTYNGSTTPTGMSLIIALNTADLSTPGNSLEARLLKRLILDGHLSGVVSGSPQ